MVVIIIIMVMSVRKQHTGLAHWLQFVRFVNCSFLLLGILSGLEMLLCFNTNHPQKVAVGRFAYVLHLYDRVHGCHGEEQSQNVLFALARSKNLDRLCYNTGIRNFRL